MTGCPKIVVASIQNVVKLGIPQTEPSMFHFDVKILTVQFCLVTAAFKENNLSFSFF